MNPTTDFASFGIHPNDASNLAYSIPKLEHALMLSNCLAIGECGLDKYSNVDFNIQQNSFIQQVQLAEKFQKPLIIHCVKAWNEIKTIKKQMNPIQPWVFHGFRKTGILDQVLQENLFVSIGTSILFDQNLQKILPQIPLEQLFLETDNDTNHSIDDVYQKVSAILEIPMEVLEKQLLNSFIQHFKYPL